jgi:hypothetical protein
MRSLSFVAVVAVASLAAWTVSAADPPARGGWFMAHAPPADVDVTDVEGGASIVLKARDPKQVDALRKFARELADHYQKGCPMSGGGPGRGPAMAGERMCPALAKPAATPGAP